jgi:surface polysaccharide O-acyltransferase-like enzyme
MVRSRKAAIRQDPDTRPNRAFWLDYLRAFITVLVVAHHSSLAYTTFASFNKQAYNASTHPIVDTVRSGALDIFEDFNDVFFMSLMFLISGIFVLPALARKGRRTFIRDRFYRLFIPFLIAVTVLMPLAYLSSWHLAHGNYDLGAFLVDFITVEHWPAGPPWFIQLLFFFNIIVAALYLRWRPTLDRWASALAGLAGKPFRVGLFWYVFSFCLYLPLVLIFGASAWTGIGPFAFQLSRILLYFGYFVLGMLLGAAGTDKGLLAEGSAFNRYWPFWLILCTLASGLKLAGVPISALVNQNRINEWQARLLYRPIWTLSCTASCIAFLTIFRHRFHNTTRKAWDSLAANAYGIYLVHYIFVLWTQFLLLPAKLPALTKFALSFTLSLALSWLLTALLRKIPIVRKYL